MLHLLFIRLLEIYLIVLESTAHFLLRSVRAVLLRMVLESGHAALEHLKILIVPKFLVRKAPVTSVFEVDRVMFSPSDLFSTPFHLNLLSRWRLSRHTGTCDTLGRHFHI